MANNLLWRS